MGFYGNVVNKKNAQYVFDKIYSNRVSMDAAIDEEKETDNVYIGRYVLVSYEYGNDKTYQENYDIDFEKYGNVRGYDSTVWQKTYVNGIVEYVMIEELNISMPTFIIVPEAPSTDPTAPYFDWYGSNIYNFHTSPNWGMQVRPIAEGEKSDAEIVSGEKTYDGAIYFNKAGFDREKTNYTKEKDEIKLTPTGISGKLYNGEPAADIQELSIILPSLGNAISDIWDTVYGAGDPDRNLDIQWGSTKGIRLTKNEDGYTYDDSKESAINTLAGCINTAHDLMGMIIVDDVDTVDKASIENIYYGNLDGTGNKFFIKYPYYDYEVLDQAGYEALLENAITPKDLVEFSTTGPYYIKTNEGFQKDQTGIYKKGTLYYKIQETPIELDGSYEPLKYYYLDVATSNYLLDDSEEPNKSIYYDIEFEPKVYGNIYFYNPTPHTQIDTDTYTGLFYVDGEGTLYKIDGENDPAFDATGKYFIGKNYTFTQEYDTNGRPITIYNFGETIDVQMIQFEKNRYYYREQVGLDKYNYIYLSDVNKVDSTKIYGELTLTLKDKEFYKPNTYCYKNGEDYILGTEKKMQDKDYFILSGIDKIDLEFYEPGIYYYNDDALGIDKIDYNPTMTTDRSYFEKNFAYVYNDERDILDRGAQWNSNVLIIPENITLASRTERWGWKELTDFGDKLNTINGLIVYINNLLKIDDIYTRDNKTVQGCINLMNDMINTFSTLLPGELMMVDEYGRIVSAPITITPDRTEKYIDIQINKDSKDHGININYTALLQKIEELESRVKALEG